MCPRCQTRVEALSEFITVCRACKEYWAQDELAGPLEDFDDEDQVNPPEVPVSA